MVLFDPRLQSIITQIEQVAKALNIAEKEVNDFVRTMTELSTMKVPIGEVKREVDALTQKFADITAFQNMNSQQSRQWSETFKVINNTMTDILSKQAQMSQQAIAPTTTTQAPQQKQMPTAAVKKEAAEFKQTTDQIKQTWQSLGAAIASNNPFLSVEQATEKARTALMEYGFAAEHIKTTADPTSNITTLTGVMTDAEGNTRSLTMRVDELGRITTQTSDRFSTFSTRLSNSIQQFARWTIAAALVYKPLQILGEQTEILIRNQAELANIAIVLGKNEELVGRAFDAVADSARLAGESIDGVLEGYTQALRATGNITNEYERFTVANELLADSLVLSKLSTFNQAQAMDTLVASLSQAGMGLDQGKELLDRWVAVTKIANVDLRTLAESYAIVGSVAESAGITIADEGNELVGLIAVLAEQTQLSATETGNALRAALTGISTSAAQDELRSFGIAITDVNGEARGFLDIADEISTKFAQGLIDEGQLTGIARAIGGGTRRQSQVEIILKSLTRAQDINEQSAKNSGAAYDALETSVDTLQSSVTNLGNALQELAETWGTDGGLLDLAQVTVEVITALVDGLNSLSGALGGSLPGLLAIGGATLLGMGGKGPMAGIVGRAGAGAEGPMIGPRTKAQSIGYNIGRGVGTYGPGIALGAAATFPTALGHIAEGEGGATLAVTAGSAIGGVIGNTLMGPAGIGAGMAIGGAITEAFITGIELEEDKITKILTGEAFQEGDGDEDDPTAVAEKFTKQMAQEIGAYFTGGRGGESFQQAIGEMYTGGTAAFGGFMANFMGATEDSSIVMNQFGGAVDWTRPDVQEQIATLVMANIPGGMEMLQARQQELMPTATEQESARMESQFQTLFGGTLDRLQSTLLQSTTGMATTGELSGREISQRRTTIAGLDSLFAELYATKEATGAGLEFTPEQMDASARAFIGATDEQRDSLNAMSTSLREYRQMLDDFSGGMIEVADGVFVSFSELEKMTRDLAGAQAAYLDELRIQQKYAAFEKPSIVGANVGGLSQSQITFIINRALQYQGRYEQGTFGGDEELIEEYRDDINEVVLEFSNGVMIPISQMAQEIHGLPIDARAFRKAFNDAIEEGVARLEEARNMGFFDVPFASGSSAAQSILGGAAYQQQLAELQSISSYTENLEDTFVLYSNNQVEAMSLDMAIVQLLLGQIEENTEEMVDGIYNLPTDGTFYVPFTGYQAGFANAGGGLSASAIANAIYQAIGDPLEGIEYNTAQLLVQEEAGFLAAIQSALVSAGEVYTGYGAGFDQTAIDPGAVQDALAGAGEVFTGAQFSQNPDFYKYALGLEEEPEGPSVWDKFFELMGGGGTNFLAREMSTEGRINPKTGIAETGSALGEVLTASLGPMVESLNNQPVEVKIDLTAYFETFIDGETVANVSKRYITDELVRKGTSQGVNISSVI